MAEPDHLMTPESRQAEGSEEQKQPSLVPNDRGNMDIRKISVGEAIRSGWVEELENLPELEDLKIVSVTAVYLRTIAIRIRDLQAEMGLFPNQEWGIGELEKDVIRRAQKSEVTYWEGVYGKVFMTHVQARTNSNLRIPQIKVYEE